MQPVQFISKDRIVKYQRRQYEQPHPGKEGDLGRFRGNAGKYDPHEYDREDWNISHRGQPFHQIEQALGASDQRSQSHCDNGEYQPKALTGPHRLLVRSVGTHHATVDIQAIKRGAAMKSAVKRAENGSENYRPKESDQGGRQHFRYEQGIGHVLLGQIRAEHLKRDDARQHQIERSRQLEY